MRPLATILYLVINLAVIGLLPQMNLGGSFLLRLVTVALLTFFAILVHELGHALAVRWVGGQVKVIAVVPFRLQIRPRRFTLAPPSRRGDIGGYVSYTLDRIDPRGKHGLIAAAGPGANIVLAALAAIAAMLLAAQSHAVSGYPASFPTEAEIAGWLFRRKASDLANALALLSGSMALLNLIPFKGSDGHHILYALSARYRRTRSG